MLVDVTKRILTTFGAPAVASGVLGVAGTTGTAGTVGLVGIIGTRGATEGVVVVVVGLSFNSLKAAERGGTLAPLPLADRARASAPLLPSSSNSSLSLDDGVRVTPITSLSLELDDLPTDQVPIMADCLWFVTLSAISSEMFLVRGEALPPDLGDEGGDVLFCPRGLRGCFSSFSLDFGELLVSTNWTSTAYLCLCEVSLGFVATTTTCEVGPGTRGVADEDLELFFDDLLRLTPLFFLGKSEPRAIRKLDDNNDTILFVHPKGDGFCVPA